MFSDKAVKTFDGCRFCPMCRHLCPVGLKTGNEGNTPRAKALLASYVVRGMQFSAEMAEDMYECCLCYACATDCESGYEPPLFIREARTLAAVDGLIPANVQKVIDNLAATGNIFGLPAADRFAALADDLKGLPEKADTLLYIGATAAYKTPEIAKAMIAILKKAGMNFTVLKDEPASGAELGDLIGFVDDVRQVSAKCAEAMAKTGAKEIVSLDPLAARMFKHQYAEWNIGIAKPFTATASIAELIASGKLKPKKTNIAATYQDDAVLTRELDELEPVREIMTALGVNLKELFLNRKRVKICGTVLLNEYAPRLTTLTGEGRWDDIVRSKMPVLLSATPDVYYVMQKTKPEGVEMKDLFVLLAENI